MQFVTRFLWIIMFALWQGGFMFYGAIIVPVGTKVLGSASLQGMVTQSVTNYLNIIGILALMTWLCELLLRRDVHKIRHYLCSTLLVMMMILLGMLGWLHTRLDQLLDVEPQVVLHAVSFARLHSWYLIISTIQWTLSLALTGLTIWAWHDGQQDAC